MRTSLASSSIVVIAAVLASVATGAWAQVTQPQSDTSLEEITVTAQKRAENMQVVPIAITAFTGEDLKKKQAVTLEALQGQVPNVQIGSFPNTPRTAVFYIRGMGAIESNLYAGSTVQVVVDGVPQAFGMVALLNLYDIERIEVNRGPQGTLYGANTTGGVVNVVTYQPTGEFDGNARVTLGNWGRIDANAALNFPIAEGVLAGKVVAMSSSRDGWFTDVVTGKDLGSSSVTALRGYLEYTPSDDFNATLIGELSHSRNGAPVNADGSVPGDLYYQPPGSSPGPGLGTMYQQPCLPGKRCKAPDKYLSAQGTEALPDESNMDIYSGTLTMNWDTSFGQVTSITGYKHFDLKEYTDADNTPWFFMDTYRPTNGWQFTQEVRDNFQAADNVDVIAGVFYIYDTYQHEQNFRPMFALKGLRQLTTEDQKNWSIAAYAHSFIHFTEKLSLQIGGRFAHEYTKMTDTSENFLNFGCGGTCDTVWYGDTPIGGFEISANDSWDEWAAKVGLDYQQSDDMFMYGFWSHGFKSGGFVGRITYPEDIGPYDPEYVDTLEGGIKTDFLDDRLRANLAVFYNWYKDMQLPIIYYDTDPQTGAVQHSTTIVNAAKAETYGFELEVTAVVAQGLTLNGALGYLHAEYSDFPFVDPSTVGGAVPTEINLKGYRLQNSPKWTSTLGLNYEHPLGSGTIEYSVSYSYVSMKFDTNLQNTPRSEVQPTNLFDANIQWGPDSGRWSVALWGLNLFDKRYISSVFDGGPGTLAIAAYAPPRQYGVNFNYNW